MKKKVLLPLTAALLSISVVGCEGPDAYTLLNEAEWVDLFGKLTKQDENKNYIGNFTLKDISAAKSMEGAIIVINKGDLKVTNGAVKGVQNSKETYAAATDQKDNKWYELEQNDSGVYVVADNLSTHPCQDIISIFEKIQNNYNEYNFDDEESQYNLKNPIEWTSSSGKTYTITNTITFFARPTINKDKVEIEHAIKYFDIKLTDKNDPNNTGNVNFKVQDIGTTVVSFPKISFDKKPGEVDQDIWNTAFLKLSDDKKDFRFRYYKQNPETKEKTDEVAYNITPTLEDKLDSSGETFSSNILVKSKNNVYHKVDVYNGTCTYYDYNSKRSYFGEIIKDYENIYSYDDFKYDEDTRSYKYKDGASKETDVQITFNTAKEAITEIIKTDEIDKSIEHHLEFSHFNISTDKDITSYYNPTFEVKYDSGDSRTIDANPVFMERIFGVNGSGDGGLNLECEYHKLTKGAQEGDTQYLTMYNKSNFKIRSAKDEEGKYKYYKESATTGTYDVTSSDGKAAGSVKYDTLPAMNILYNTETWYNIFKDISTNAGFNFIKELSTNRSYYCKTVGEGQNTTKYIVEYSPTGDGQLTLEIHKTEGETTHSDKFIFTKYNLTTLKDVVYPN